MNKEFRWRMAMMPLAFAFPNNLRAQDAEFSGNQSNEYAKWVEAKTTAPRIISCRKGGSKCFRVMIELTPSIPDEVGISISSPRMTAFSGGGANCIGFIKGGIGNFAARDRLRDQWDMGRLTFADSSKPAMAIFDFECDFPIISGDEVTYQITFDFYVSARNYGEARYIFRRIRLTE